ncbi:Cellulose synthase [Dillenia turbinata]|uniref:Cellulose synthase n=1 Tax=Dillenia turbinata TaxID=194707 RepID=A0AAN8VDU1_9MAGN
MDSLPLFSTHVPKTLVIINRLYTLICSIGILSLMYFRVSSLFITDQLTNDKTRLIPSLLIFASEFFLLLIWLAIRLSRWRMVSRTPITERLPKDEKLPGIDVFIFTADPNIEPTVDVMTTVISAMAMDYPPEKLHVYVSDDAGSSKTQHGMREAWLFARSWLPFCKKYKEIVKTRSPELFFSASESGFGDDEFIEEMKKIKGKYEEFKERVNAYNVSDKGASTTTPLDHPTAIEVLNIISRQKKDVTVVIGDNSTVVDQVKMPLLVYVAREKRPSQPHHFKAGAINALLRVSALKSNSPYVLLLDCDMQCNDPSSARQAMCFHLDPKISPTLAFVIFPQKFRNIGPYDIYDGSMRSTWELSFPGLDGLQGPFMSGTCCYIKRKALLGNSKHQEIDLSELKNHFGASNKFINSLRDHDHDHSSTPDEDSSNVLQEEMQLLASSTYERNTKWGEEASSQLQVGFYYASVVEDCFTGYMLHCKGWTSVYCNPSTPQFLGRCPPSLNILLIQLIRWTCGLLDFGFSRFCPLVYGPRRMSILMACGYACTTLFPLPTLSIWCLAAVPQLCLFNGISLYPKVSSYSFIIFASLFLSWLLGDLIEALLSGGSIQTWINEERIALFRAVTSYLYGFLEAVMKKIGMRKANFVITDKGFDMEQIKLYQMGLFDFRASNMFLVPLVTLTILNIISFLGGLTRVIVAGNWEDMFGHFCLSVFILVMSYPIIEGIFVRKDKGRIPIFVVLVSSWYSVVFLVFGRVILMY